jgi:hypothetical protein
MNVRGMAMEVATGDIHGCAHLHTVSAEIFGLQWLRSVCFRDQLVEC